MNLETTMAVPLPENTDGPRAAMRRPQMGVRDDLNKAIDDVRKDLSDAEGHLKWLLDEVERHLGLGHAPEPAPAAEPENEPEEAEEEAADEVVTPQRGRPRKTAN